MATRQAAPQPEAKNTLVASENRGKILARMKTVRSRKTQSLHIGVIRSPRYPKGPTIASIMLLLEKGSNDGRIPARRLVATTVETYGDNWMRMLENGLRRGEEPDQTFRRIGPIGARDMRRMFTDSLAFFQSNAPSTIKRKGFDHPYVETKQMQNAIGWSRQEANTIKEEGK